MLTSTLFSQQAFPFQEINALKDIQQHNQIDSMGLRNNFTTVILILQIFWKQNYFGINNEILSQNNI